MRKGWFYFDIRRGWPPGHSWTSEGRSGLVAMIIHLYIRETACCVGSKMKNSSSVRMLSIAISLLLPLGGVAAANAQTGGGSDMGRFCGGGSIFFGNNFESLRMNLDNSFPRSGRVWQAPNDTAVWKKWCEIQGQTASWGLGSGAKPSSVKLDDGTRVGFRATSKSGGFTIDINSPTHSKDFKVHVAR